MTINGSGCRASPHIIGIGLNTIFRRLKTQSPVSNLADKGWLGCYCLRKKGKSRGATSGGLAPIFPYTFYHLTHYWSAAADIPVVNDIPVHYADAIRYNVRRPPQGSLPLLTRRASA
jgi:hypothetical protein